MALSQDTSEDPKDSKEVFDKIEVKRLLLDFKSDEVRDDKDPNLTLAREKYSRHSMSTDNPLYAR